MWHSDSAAGPSGGGGGVASRWADTWIDGSVSDGNWSWRECQQRRHVTARRRLGDVAVLPRGHGVVGAENR